MKAVFIYILSFFVILFISIFFVLLNGVHLNNLSYKNINIKHLYLRYDKNILLDLDSLKISDNNKEIVNISTVLNLSYTGAIIKKLNLSSQNIALTGIVKFNFIDIFQNKNIKLIIDDVDFMFEPELPHLKAKQLNLEYKNDNITLIFDKPNCDNIALDGTTAIIENITSNKNTVLKVYLKSKALLKTNLLNILKFYNIKLPFHQTSGTNIVTTNLIIPFNDEPISISATVKSKDTKIRVNNIFIPVKNLDVILKNQIITTNVNINEATYKIDISNITNLKINKSTGDIKIKKLQYGHTIDIKNESLAYSFNIDKNILMIPKFGFYYTIGTNHDFIYIRYLNKLIKYLPFITNSKAIESGMYIDSTDNFKTIDITINDLYLKIDESYFDKNSDDTIKTILPLLNITLIDGQVLYKDYNFIYTTLKVHTEASDVDFKYINKDSIIFLNTNINKKTLHIKSNKTTDKVINTITNKDLLKDGYLGFTADGSYDELKGRIIFNKTTIQNVPLLNSLITFINTTPAIINPLLALPTLFRLGERSFDLQGYYIKNGLVNFKYNTNNKILNLLDIYTQSKMMDFKGKGDINLDNKLLDLNIDAIFLKDYSKFVNHIPVVGYILTGDDESISTQIDINGTLDDPNFITHTIKNTAEGIGEGLIRLFTFPVKLFDNNKSK